MSDEEAEEKPLRAAVRAGVTPPRKIPRVKPARRVAPPVKGMSKRACSETVKDKILAIQEAAAKFQSGVRAIESAISEQVGENQEAAAKFQSGVRAIQSAISEQIKENQEYVRKFYG